MLSTVLGASSSNISNTMSPLLVVIVISDIAYSAFREFQAQPVAAHIGSVDRVGHAGGLVAGHLEEHEPLQQPHVADRLPVEAHGGHRADQVRLGEARCA